jgi:hypothetical protein
VLHFYTATRCTSKPAPKDAIETGVVELDLVADRLRELKTRKKELQAELAERLKPQELPAHMATQENIRQVQDFLKALFFGDDKALVKRYLTYLLEEVVLDGKVVVIRAKTEGMLATLAQGKDLRKNGTAGVISGVIHSSNKWQPVGESNPCDRTENPAS